MSNWYALVGQEVVGPFDTLDKWYQASAGLFWRLKMIEAGEPDPWRLAYTDLPNGGFVSTVFLGLDHAWGGRAPEVFETMVFPECETCIRSSTFEGAMNME